MFVYIALLLLIFMLWEFRLSPSYGILLIFILMFLLLALRSKTLGLNDTQGVYYIAFQRMRLIATPFEAVKDQHFLYEPLMAMYMWASAHCLINFQLFVAVSACIPLLATYRLVKLNSLNQYLSTYIFFCLYFFYATFLIKQMISIAFIIFAYMQLRDNKIFRFIMFVILASLIHKSAWIFLIAYPACRWFKFNSKTLLGTGVLITVGALFPAKVISFLLAVDPTGLFKPYLADGIYELSSGGYNFGVFLNIIILFLCWLCRTKVKKNQDIFDKLLILVAIGCILNSYSVIIVEFYRLALFFSIFTSLLIPMAIESLESRTSRQVWMIVSYLGLGIYCLTRVIVNTGCLPYQTFF